MKLKYLNFVQPIGEFIITVMKVNEILKIARIDKREFDQFTLDSKGGPQRETSKKRIREIAEYSETPDATFPTPILLALPNDKYDLDENYIDIADETEYASVVDGQHRLLGLELSTRRDEFTLPVIFILDPTEEQKALIFAIINGKQTRVSASIIYDLFGVIEGRSPNKTAHEIARALNRDVKSPFYRRLKMLGKKFKGSNESLSQGTFVTQLVKLITRSDQTESNIKIKPDLIFNRYYIEEKDEFILKVLLNVFSAIEEAFPEEWNNPKDYILSKTTGYTAIISALPAIFKIGEDKKNLSKEFFLDIFNKLKINLISEGKKLNSENYSPNKIGEDKLKDEILKAMNEIISSD